LDDSTAHLAPTWKWHYSDT